MTVKNFEIPSCRSAHWRGGFLFFGDFMNKVIASFSGGKDSTAMLIRGIEEGMRIDDIVMFDTGWEFPGMMDHVRRVEKYISREITILHPRRSFEYWMIDRPIKSRFDRPAEGIKKGEVFRIGNGWPSPMRRAGVRGKRLKRSIVTAEKLSV